MNNSDNNNVQPVKIGISGGTFDPVHHGHLIIAEYVREKFSLDKVIFIPSGNPPHKDLTRVTEAEHRFEMVKEAVASNPFLELSRIEIDRNGMTYTVDTLHQLKNALNSDAKLFFIIGADVVLDLVTWRNYTEVFGLCEFIAVFRPGYDRNGYIREIEMLKARYDAKIHIINAPLIDISSTAIRERVKNGNSIKYLVPEAVERYIIDNGLYI